MLAISLMMAACRSPVPGQTTAPAQTTASHGTKSPIASGSAAAATLPNIVLILADDLGYADVSTYHAQRIPTPNIDRIGREGVIFSRGYASAPICSPARAALMTGRHQQRFGFEFNTGPPAVEIPGRRGLDPNERTIADLLRAAGYRTAAIGKWHLGSSPEMYPTNRGFDEFWGFLSGQTNHIRHDAPDAVNALPPQPGTIDLVRPTVAVSAGNAVIAGVHRERVDLGDGLLTEQLTGQALAFVARNRDRPFFLYLAHHAPHTPLQTTRKYFDRFPHIPDRSQRIYAAMVSALDDGVGALLNQLDALGLAGNTLVIFLSDNGCAAYLPGICSDQPLSGGKLTYLEGGVRIPYLVRWPDRIAAGTRHANPVSSLDVLPTLVRAAGVALPADRAFDGVDLLTQLAAAHGASRTLHWRSQPMRAVLQDNWKYLRTLDGNEFLYDLANDPQETRNLSAARGDRLADLQGAFARWEADKIAPRWLPARRSQFTFGARSFEFTP